MIHQKNRKSLKPLPCDLSPLVLHRTVVLVLLAHFCIGHSQVIGQPQPIVAMAGDDIILPCYLEPAFDAVSLTVEWARADLNPRFVHVRREGVELLIDQNPSYIGRTSVPINKLKCGDLSLKLSKVKLSDDGTYRCLVPKQGTQSEVKLAVGLVSSPVLRLSRLSSESSGVLLECESTGWYPEPEVFWLDGEGNVLSAGPTETVRGPDDLYTVSSRVTVEKRHSNSFTCRVQQNHINQTRETHIHVPEDLFVVPSCPVGRIIIVSVVGFISILAVVLGAFLIGRKEIKTKTIHDDKTELGEHQSQTGPDRESSQLLTEKVKKNHMNKSNENLDEESFKNEEQLIEVLKIIETLKNHRKDLKSQKEKVSAMFMEILEKKKMITEEEKKLTEEEKKKREKEDKKLLKNKREIKLRRRTAARDEIFKNTEKLMDTTEDMIITMIEIKVRLEEDQKQVNKQLKEVKRLDPDENRQSSQRMRT